MALVSLSKFSPTMQADDMLDVLGQPDEMFDDVVDEENPVLVAAVFVTEDNPDVIKTTGARLVDRCHLSDTEELRHYFKSDLSGYELTGPAFRSQPSKTGETVIYYVKFTVKLVCEECVTFKPHECKFGVDMW